MIVGRENDRIKSTNNAPIPKDNRQHCFRRPLKFEVHMSYCFTEKVKCSISFAFHTLVIAVICS